MTTFQPQTIESAPEGARPLLKQVDEAYGFVPNLAAVMSNAPALLQGYLGVSGAFATASLSPAEQQVVALAASAENECDYCMAAHSTIAARAGLSADAIEGLRTSAALSDARLEALRTFTTRVVVSRGRPTEAEVQAFLGAGFEPAQILEVVLGVAMKTLTNYTNHIADTPLDDVFAGQRWEPTGAKA